MQSRMMAPMNLFAWQQWRCRYREQICGHSGGCGGWDKLRQQHGNNLDVH